MRASRAAAAIPMPLVQLTRDPRTCSRRNASTPTTPPCRFSPRARDPHEATMTSVRDERSFGGCNPPAVAYGSSSVSQ